MQQLKTTPKKTQKSSRLGKFLIYIQEDENGHVWIQSDSVGQMGKAFDIGCEIINNLVAAEAANPDSLTVGDLMISSGWQ